MAALANTVFSSSSSLNLHGSRAVDVKFATTKLFPCEPIRISPFRIVATHRMTILCASTSGTGAVGSTSFKADQDFDYVPMPIVMIDQDSDPDATIVQLSFGDRLGALLDTMKALKDLGLDVAEGTVLTEGSVIQTKFFTTRLFLANYRWNNRKPSMKENLEMFSFLFLCQIERNLMDASYNFLIVWLTQYFQTKCFEHPKICETYLYFCMYHHHSFQHFPYGFGYVRNTGRKVEDPDMLERIRLTIITNLLKYHPESSEKLAMGEAFGISAPEKKLDIDVATRIHVKEDGPKKSLLYIETADRPGLLVEIIKIIADINIDVESAEIDTEGLVAKDRFHVSYRGAPLNDSLSQVLTNCLRYYLRRPETDIDSY